MENEVKEPVKIRRKTLKNGNISLYLDIYLKGRRHYEFLRLYLVPERNKADREKNRQTIQLANSVKAMRIVEIQNNEYGFKSEYAEDASFYDYYVALTEKRRSDHSKGNWGNWQSCLIHLERYDGNLKHLTFADITPKWVQGFKDYLEKKAYSSVGGDGKGGKGHRLGRNTQVSYYNKFRTCILQACRDRIITENPLRAVGGIKAEEVARKYLTVEEVQRLYMTECECPVTKRAFLFSCLTGLRRCDVQRLTWADVQRQGNFTRIVFRQKKTGGQEYLDINEQAAALLGEAGNPGELIFGDIKSPTCLNNTIQRWVLRAGIDKKITFHCARHTFAVMMLDLGTDIYTVSKLLGHRELTTTQIYAKVLDKNKQAAVSRIPDMFAASPKREDKED